MKFYERLFANLGLAVFPYRAGYVYVPSKQAFPPTPPSDDPDYHAFCKLADELHSKKKTMLANDRLLILWQAVKNTVGLPGSGIEVGTYKGGAAWFANSAFRHFESSDIRFRVLDTFEGHPDVSIEGVDATDVHVPGHFSDTSEDGVRSLLSDFKHVSLHKGDCSKVVLDLEEDQYRYAHLDVDFYQSTLDCLNYLHPRMVKGGIIVVDDYGSKNCKGIQLSTDEFLVKHRDDYITWFSWTKQLVFIRK
jgi:hypothetical protein